MKRSCKSLKYGEAVVFLIYSDIYKHKIHEWGTVVAVEEDFVEVSWMEGFRERFNKIPILHFDNIYGPSDLLEG